MDDKQRELFKVGKECYDGGDFTKAEKYFKEVLALNDQYPDIHNMLGLIYHDQGKYSQAISSFEKAIALNPRYVEASVNLAVTYNDLGKYKEAKKVYQKAKQTMATTKSDVDPYVKGKLANMHAELGDNYRELRFYDEAIVEYTKALVLRPKFLDIKIKLADTYRDQGETEKAIKEYTEAKKLGKDFNPLNIKLGLVYYTVGEVVKARAEWEGVLAREPNDKKAKMYLNLIKETKDESPVE